MAAGPCQGSGAEAEVVSHPVADVVLQLPHIEVPVSQPFQLLLWIGGTVDLHGHEGLVVVHAQTVHLPSIEVLVEGVAQHGHLLARGIVDDLAHELVRALAGRCRRR